uniref:hypothetical protein n=1 Tax=Cohnella rhizosphaerae TaxID=1457232 RepID=UPI0030B8B946
MRSLTCGSSTSARHFSRRRGFSRTPASRYTRGEFSEMKRALIETAQLSYVTADHHKFGQGALFTFAQLTEVEAIVTDAGLSPEVAAQYRQAGVRLLINEEKEG